MLLSVKPTTISSQSLSQCAWLHPSVLPQAQHVDIKTSSGSSYVYPCRRDDQLNPTCVYLNETQRNSLYVTFDEKVTVTDYRPATALSCLSLKVELSAYGSKMPRNVNTSYDHIMACVRTHLNHRYVKSQQKGYLAMPVSVADSRSVDMALSYQLLNVVNTTTAATATTTATTTTTSSVRDTSRSALAVSSLVGVSSVPTPRSVSTSRSYASVVSPLVDVSSVPTSRSVSSSRSAASTASPLPTLEALPSFTSSYGYITADTHIELILAPELASTYHLNVENMPLDTPAQRDHIIKEWDLEKLGLGGLDNQFDELFRRAFASRIFTPQQMTAINMKHVKGVMLYGAPGTGKTKTARVLAQMLNTVEPKIVKGPEILNSYIGKSEEAIRKLFADADAEYKSKGDNSNLHVIIFDEIDCICRTRGSRSDSTGVHDNVVAQLLSVMDGVNSLNNILVIGMTNRLDMIDPALLRPGRFEVHLEFKLPDRAGRVAILKIHTQALVKSGKLAADVDLEALADATENYSGAELEGVVRDAVNGALNRQVHRQDKELQPQWQDVLITQADLDRARHTIQPALGRDQTELNSVLSKPLVPFCTDYDQLVAEMTAEVDTVLNGRYVNRSCLLIKGPRGSGKTTQAYRLARDTGFSCVKIVSAFSLMGKSESARCDALVSAFTQAYASARAVIVVDDLERIIEYSSVGPRFSNSLLQTLLVCLTRDPPPTCKLVVVATANTNTSLNNVELTDVFTRTWSLPGVNVATVAGRSVPMELVDMPIKSVLARLEV